MITETTIVQPAANTGATTSYVEWGAIIAGAVIASAISLVFLQFGSGIGLAWDSPFRTDTLTLAGAIAVALWMLWVQISASFAGGYVAGRMRRPVNYAGDHEREIRDGMHGLLVWATGTVAVALVLATGAAIAAFLPDVQAATTGVTTTDPAVVSQAEAEHLAHNAGVILAFLTAAVSFVSGAAAWWAATMGGHHRDHSVDHSRYLSFRRR